MLDRPLVSSYCMLCALCVSLAGLMRLPDLCCQCLLQLAMENYSWLWLNEDLSDVRIRLVYVKPRAGTASDSDESQAAEPALTRGLHRWQTPSMHAGSGSMRMQPGTCMDEVCKELPAHAAVLASNSGYWKARLLRWRSCTATKATASAVTEPAAAAMGQAERVHVPVGEASCSQSEFHILSIGTWGDGEPLTPASASATDPATTLSTLADAMPGAMLEQVDGPADFEAAYNTIQHAYTHKLPTDATFTMLMQMAICADKWDMPQTVEACLSQAAKIDDLTVHDINTTLRDELPPTIKAHEGFKLLISNCTAALLKQFGRAQAVVVQPELLQSFCSLNLNAVQLWAEQGTVQVDSENTVAVLFTHWWDRNSSNLSEQQMEAACAALTESLRVGQVTATFLSCTLWDLPWFKPTTDAAAALKVLHGTELHEHRDDVRSLYPIGWVKAARAQDKEQDKALEWVVTKAQLNELHKEAGQGKAYLWLESSLYWSGYRWQVGLCLPDQKSALEFGIRYLSAMPKCLIAAGCPPLLPASFYLTVNKQAGPATCGHTFDRTSPMTTSRMCGSATFLGVPGATEPRAHSYPPDNLWKDGKLHLQVKMGELW